MPFPAGPATPVRRTSERALHCVASAGPHGRGAIPHRVPFDSALPPAIQWRLRDPVLIDDWRQFELLGVDPGTLQIWREMGIKSAAGFPLEFRGEQLGSIGFLARRRITTEEFALLGIFADQAALAIRNAQLYREVERYRDRLELENAYLQEAIAEERGFEGIVGESPALRAVLRKVQQVAPVETTVLLTGETGTGKELIARALHQGSPRRDRPLIKVNCGAIPQGVVESELFGHEKGAFTGALQRRIGRFELADKGTLFMDEVGELPLDTQVKLLRVLQEREFERVGSTGRSRWTCGWWRRPTATWSRRWPGSGSGPTCSTGSTCSRSGCRRCGSGRATSRCWSSTFWRSSSASWPSRSRAVTPESLARLERYAWPGNIRELQNVLERACVLSPGPVVEIVEELRSDQRRASRRAASAGRPAGRDRDARGERADPHPAGARRHRPGRVHGRRRRRRAAGDQPEHPAVSDEEARHHETARLITARSREAARCRDGPAFGAARFRAALLVCNPARRRRLPPRMRVATRVAPRLPSDRRQADGCVP